MCPLNDVVAQTVLAFHTFTLEIRTGSFWAVLSCTSGSMVSTLFMLHDVIVVNGKP